MNSHGRNVLCVSSCTYERFIEGDTSTIGLHARGGGQHERIERRQWRIDSNARTLRLTELYEREMTATSETVNETVTKQTHAHTAPLLLPASLPA
jgi:hypothetical protein